ncbi:tropomyosin Lep s 1.0101-like [Littorina saxatilis]|uniref:Uncharacterized protein n=1 Tax=Littorina saxatilis TaxID=31220 RepID=A0AAN9GPU7_9CAEN
MEAENNVELAKEAKRLLSEMNLKQFEACKTNVGPDEITDQLQELSKTKPDLKEKFHKTVAMNTFMKNVAKPQEEWASLKTQSEEELQTAKKNLSEAKHAAEDKKTQMMQLNNVVEQGLALYEQNVNALNEKQQMLDSMTQELKILHERLLDSEDGDDEALFRAMEAEYQRYCAQIKECRKQLLQIGHKTSQMHLNLSQMENDLQQLSLTLDEDAECMDAQCLSRLQKSITDIESQSGITCKPVNKNTMMVEFPPRPEVQTLTGGNGTPDDLVLKVTLTFQENNLGYPRLSNIKSNMDSFDVDDLWKEFKEDSCDSLPQLISSIKLRWFSHMPLLSEINHLRSKFAIDWIQQENILRVIVGKGGGIVCSLEIPDGYPHQGQVTLTGIMGAADDILPQDLKPHTGGRLEDWVQLLETTFGKP